MAKKRVAKKKVTKPKPKGMSRRKKAAIAGAGIVAASAAVTVYAAHRKIKKKRVFPP